jgi:flagellar basal body rod protein FlgG
MDMTANNIANANTPGYRNQNPMFQEFISKPQGASQPLSLVLDKGQYDTTSPGPAQYSGGTYDVALQGPGFMEIKTATGDTQYTRAGNFTIDGSGLLTTSSGLQVGNTPIIIPPGTQSVVITEDGGVVADGNNVGKISMTEFDNLQDLEPQGNGLYAATVPGTPATTTTMKQGMLEGSNVNTITEMTRMIEISREYERTMSMLKNEGDRKTGAIQQLAKVNG